MDQNKFPELLGRATSIQRHMDYEADVQLGLRVQVDEVAILFKDSAVLSDFVAWCVREGVDNFNSVERDTMRRQDTDGQFDVRFEFLRIPGMDWRIEAMCVLDGMAPLHDSQADGSIIHASYKLEDAWAYANHQTKLNGGLIKRQAEYVNSYGRFSYWGPGAPYLKPRVNLRDVQ